MTPSTIPEILREGEKSVYFLVPNVQRADSGANPGSVVSFRSFFSTEEFNFV
jgi:hypothetical protein